MKIPEQHRIKWKPLIDRSIDLTPRENEIIAESIDRVVRSILRREKGRLKRRVLRHCIIINSELSANAAFGRAEKRAWQLQIREEIKKSKKLTK